MVSISCRVGESNNGDCSGRSSSSVAVEEPVRLGGERNDSGISLDVVETEEGLKGGMILSMFVVLLVFSMLLTVVVNSLSESKIVCVLRRVFAANCCSKRKCPQLNNVEVLKTKPYAAIRRYAAIAVKK